MNKQWLLRKTPDAALTVDDFTFHESNVPNIDSGEILVRNEMLAIGPAARAWMKGETYRAGIKPGDVIPGWGIGTVAKSKAPGWSVGDVVEGSIGWQEYYAARPELLTKRQGGQPLEHLLGVLGQTGQTAYCGLLHVGNPQPGECVVVSAAAGGVGSLAAQIAKIMGCRVIGIAGGAEKCAWLLDELGLDGAIDYKSGNLSLALAEKCPQGVDVYFDNTGGPILEAVMDAANVGARIVCCGAVANYDEAGPLPVGPRGVPQTLVVKRIKMQGFLYTDFYNERARAERALGAWLAEGRLKASVAVYDRLECAPSALIDLLSGKNVGKVMVKL